MTMSTACDKFTPTMGKLETIPAGLLQAGWRIVARRGWQRAGWRRGSKYRGAPETMTERESLPLFARAIGPDVIELHHPGMPVSGGTKPGLWIIVCAVHQHRAKTRLAGGVELFHDIG